jgi:hypothetical protein
MPAARTCLKVTEYIAIARKDRTCQNRYLLGIWELMIKEYKVLRVLGSNNCGILDKC